MPVEFLSDDQVAAYGRFVVEPSLRELERFCWLSDTDRAVVAGHRGDHNRLGYAVQLATVRALGRFLPVPLEVPWLLVEFLAGQMQIADPSVLKRYAQRLPTQHEHARDIVARYGYREFDDKVVVDVSGFIAARSWLTTDGPTALFERAVSWLRDRKVLLPGVTILTRLISGVRVEQADRLHSMIIAAGEKATITGLDTLVAYTGDDRLSELERLRLGPRQVSPPEIVRQIGRLHRLVELGATTIDLSALPVVRVTGLARYGMQAKAGALRDLSGPRRQATLIATLVCLHTDACDELGDTLDLMLAGRLMRRAERETAAGRARELPRLDNAARRLATVGSVLVAALDNDELSDAEFRAIVRTGIDRAALIAAMADVAVLAPVDSTELIAAELRRRGRTISGFLPQLGAAAVLGARPSGLGLLTAISQLDKLLAKRKPTIADANIEVIASGWRKLINPDGTFDRSAYTVGLTEALHGSLRRRDIYINGGKRWGDPTTRLLSGQAWDHARPDVLAGLQLDEHPDRHIEALGVQLHNAYLHIQTQIAAADGPLSIGDDGRFHLKVLERLPVTESLKALRTSVHATLPAVELPDLLLEVHEWTGFLNEFVHISETSARMDDVALSVAAVLIGEACNVGLVPVADETRPPLTMARLSHVDQTYIRADTIRSANARLIKAQSDIPLAQRWGGGLVASVDGMRFVVPVATINAGPNPKYFGRKNGLTWLNYLNDQIAGISAVVVPGTVRDSLHVLDGLLNLDGGPKPEMIASDTASYSDQVFGLFTLLGYRFSPRLADLPDQRIWTINRHASYGPIDQVIRQNRINTGLIKDNWPDMLRLAGSLLTGTVKPSNILRVTQGNGRPTPLGRAVAEYGRIAKTLHILAFVDSDETYRRQIHTRLNTQESRHALARRIFHGRRGELRQAYREGQEDQLGALGLVLNAVVLWNTRYLDHALSDDDGLDHDDDIRLSPLGSEHINMVGRYHFETAAVSRLRPLAISP